MTKLEDQSNDQVKSPTKKRLIDAFKDWATSTTAHGKAVVQNSGYGFQTIFLDSSY